MSTDCAARRLDADEVKRLGASAEAIGAHYDVGDAFFALWLDRTLTYTCATWAEASGLEAAQTAKIDDLARRALVTAGARVLDVGCGWGGLLRRLVETHGVRQAVGLTLSPAQTSFARQHPLPGVEVRQEHWVDHAPVEPYDAIVSVEAFEAFARNGLSSDEKIAVYREFFRRCHEWLAPGGRLSLQLIAYGNSGPEDLDAFISGEIFPESDLPRLCEVTAACERLFEVVELRNDRADYGLTLKAWLANLTARRAEAAQLVGSDVVERFVRYLRLSRYMFEAGTCDLFRIALRRIDRPRRP